MESQFKIPDFEKATQSSTRFHPPRASVRTEVRRLPQPLHDGRDENGLLPHEARQGAQTELHFQ